MRVHSLNPFQDAASDGKIFTYRATLRGGHLHHSWSLIDERGGIDIHCNLLASDNFGPEWLGGAETHYAAAPDYMDPSKPSHEHCWLLGGQCWHDGSSLYFSENIAPMLPNPWQDHPNSMADRHHAAVAMELRYLHRLRFEVEDGQ